MAGESITFDFLSQGADKLSSDFRKTGDNAALAAKGARLCADALKAAGGSAADGLRAGATLLEKAEHELHADSPRPRGAARAARRRGTRGKG